MEAFIVPMWISSGTDICCPPLGRFSNDWSRVLGERMKWKEAIDKCEQYQSTEICGKCEWNSGVEWPSGVGNREQKKHRNHKKERNA
jgi:hypothetical protein